MTSFKKGTCDSQQDVKHSARLAVAFLCVDTVLKKLKREY